MAFHDCGALVTVIGRSEDPKAPTISFCNKCFPRATAKMQKLIAKYGKKAIPIDELQKAVDIMFAEIDEARKNKEVHISQHSPELKKKKIDKADLVKKLRLAHRKHLAKK
jgi:hypothetical protein